MAIDPRTAIGKVVLTVRDIGRVQAFYERAVGLTAIASGVDRVLLVAGDEPLVELVADPAAPPRARRTTGLYHLAILVPDRQELARSLRRLIGARWRLVGAADHLVSEALYLEDPEGNGIEIYRDRPRERWRRDGDEIAMATLPLDLQDLMRDLGDGGLDDGLPVGTCIGHVHLQVADLGAAERFYGDVLGFEVAARGYPGALFMSAGGYHHHLGLNTWAGVGAPAPVPGSAGLRAYEIVMADPRAVAAAAERLTCAEVAVAREGEAIAVRDPSLNAVVLRPSK